MTGPEDGTPSGISHTKRAVWGVALATVELILLALGVWQLHRRTWKHELIARVDARVNAPPLPAPGPADWPQLDPTAEEYRRVTARGHFLTDRETLVQALTTYGGGVWVLAPLVTADGWMLLVNRGFVPTDRADPASRAAGEPTGEVEVTGLLRLSEPGGSLLRRNDPAGNRWFSRDVSAIAKAHGLRHAAPYFVDADATPNPGGLPVGGLTVIAFPDNHLVYSMTWFSLAALLGGWLIWAWRSRSAVRRGP